MKKTGFLALFLLWASLGLAAESKEYIFLQDLLVALRHARQSLDYRLTGKTPAQKMVADVEEARLNLERCRQVLEKYLKEEDPLAISLCAAQLVNGLDIIVYSLDGFSGKLNSVAGLIPSGFDNTVSETARFRGQNKKGWEELSASLSTGCAPLLGSSSALTQEERAKLARRFGELFGEGVPGSIMEGPGDEVLKAEKLAIYEGYFDALNTVKEMLAHGTD